MKEKNVYRALAITLLITILILIIFLFIPILKYVFNVWMIIIMTICSGCFILPVALMQYRNKNNNPKLQKGVNFGAKLIEYWQVILISVFIVELLFGIIAFPATVQQTSMNPTLYEQDRVLVFYQRNYQNLDIVVFSYDSSKQSDNVHIEDGELLIKRVMAIPGQTFEYRDNKLYINGKISNDPFYNSKMDGLSLEDCLAHNQSELNLLAESYQEDGSYIVPEGWYVVFGDNRQYVGSTPLSIDSRGFGLIHESQIYGVVKYAGENIFKFKKIK